MKRIFEFFKSGGCLLLLFILIPVLIGLGSVFTIFAKVFLFVGGGSLVRGILMTPFFIFGVIQIVRGFAAIFDDDLENIEAKVQHKKNGYLLTALYVISLFAGYLAVFFAIFFWARS